MGNEIFVKTNLWVSFDMRTLSSIRVGLTCVGGSRLENDHETLSLLHSSVKQFTRLDSIGVLVESCSVNWPPRNGFGPIK